MTDAGRAEDTLLFFGEWELSAERRDGTYAHASGHAAVTFSNLLPEGTMRYGRGVTRMFDNN